MHKFVYLVIEIKAYMILILLINDSLHMLINYLILIIYNGIDVIYKKVLE